jgi:hypothetical protein
MRKSIGFFYLYLNLKQILKMNNLIIKRSQLIEAKIVGAPTAGKKYPFTQVPNISRNNIVIYGFEAFTADQLAVTPNGTTVIPSGAGAEVVITFVDTDNVERIFQIPYSTLISTNNGGFIKMVKPFALNLTKCYAQLVSTNNMSASEAISLNLYYSIIGE